MFALIKRNMRSYTTCMLCCTVFFLFADQNLLAPNLSAIADDFGFSDSERDEKLGGWIAFGFFIVGGPVALLVGYFTDIANRPMLFGIVVAFGESACFATFWVKTYAELFVCRVLTGISIGGATPIIFSMLGDLYPGESRIYVSTLIGVSLSAGIAGGQLLSGLVGPSLGWRAPFLFVAVPALILACLVFFTVADPVRGDQEQETRRLRNEEKAHTDYGADGRPVEARTASPHLVQQSSQPQSYFVLVQDDLSGKAVAHPAQRINSREVLVNECDDNCTIDMDTFVGQNEYNNIEESAASSHSRERDRSKSVGSDGSGVGLLQMEYAERIDCNKVLKLFSTYSVAIVFIQGFPGCLPWGMIYVFLNDYFSEDRGLSVQGATAALTCFGLGGLVGQFFGGWAGQRLYNIDPRLQCVLMGVTTLLSVLPMLYLLNTEDLGGPGFYFMALLAGFMVSMNGPNVRVVLQNVCIPEVRGTAFAVFSLTDDIGKGLGPALVVVFIKACNGDRREAFNIIVLFWLFCGVLLLLLTQTVVQDEAAVQQAVREALTNPQQDPAGYADESAHSVHNPLGIHLLKSELPHHYSSHCDRRRPGASDGYAFGQGSGSSSSNQSCVAEVATPPLKPSSQQYESI